MEQSKIYKIWLAGTLVITITALALLASITIYIDPLFHYHAPLKNYEYPINNERYQNDGITRHFTYDGIITGTSMTENFKKTEADKIFGADFIKVPFSGGRYKEINDNLKRAYAAGKKVRYVIRCLDYSLLAEDKDACREDTVYPDYLYNDMLFDDLNYILNKSILMNQTKSVIDYTKSGGQTTSFDSYANWNANYTFGAETVLQTYTLGEKAETDRVMTEEERDRILGNIRQNVTDLADEHPETIFYYFFPPYSICYWDGQNNDGLTKWQINAEKIAIEEILKHPNIRLYSFSNNFALICNLDNYKDQAHYREWINSWMLKWMHEGRYLLTKDNYMEYIESVSEFFQNYDYDSLREEEN